MFETIVYSLCAATSVICAVLLVRGYRASRARLLLWSAVCFSGLALNNLLLIIDVSIGPTVDLSAWRIVPSIIGTAALLYGLVWEAR